MSGTKRNVKPLRSQLSATLQDWVLTDGNAWVHIFKTVFAAILALLIAMRLDLPAPPTAMTTVFVLMQPQSGMVLAKSFYRFIATMLGLAVMLTITALFAQQPVLFLTATSVWVGICTTGAARNRNFRSYGFVLAGYTAALVGIPAGQHPDGAFLSALTRAAEVTVGIICSGAVSALILPAYAGEQIRNTARRRFSSFVDYVSNVLHGKVDRSQAETTHAAFVRDIVGFEAARSVAIFEQPEIRLRNGRLVRLNHEFMSASTRFHALHQLMGRLRRNAGSLTVDVLNPYFEEVAEMVDDSAQSVLNAADASIAAQRFGAYKATLPDRIRASRNRLRTDFEEPVLEFDTAAELLYRFVDDLHAYTQTYASLALPRHERERWVENYVPKTNLLAALIGGFRAALVTLALSAFWIRTAWPSGGTLVLVAAAVCALASSSPNPKRMASQMAIGATLAGLAGGIVTFHLYPKLDGFVLLAAGLAPFLMLGTYLSTRKSTAGIGVGYCIFFCFLAGPNNVILYDPTGYINNAIALTISMFTVSIAFAVIFPSDSAWMRRLLLAELRRQVVSACSARLPSLTYRFESGARDLLSQLSIIAGTREAQLHEAMKWLYAVLEVGHAVIDMRSELEHLAHSPLYARGAEWRRDISGTLRSVSALFDRPLATRAVTALAETDRAIASLKNMLIQYHPPREEHHGLQRILSHLHLIRTALLDPEAPFNSSQLDASTHRSGKYHAA
jgi:uncharacterized membrane protein YccC